MSFCSVIRRILGFARKRPSQFLTPALLFDNPQMRSRPRGCHHNNMRNRHVSWHISPKGSHLRLLWIEAIVEKTVLPQSWEPKPSYKVCGCHFNQSGTRGNMNKVPQFLEPDPFSVVTNEAAESPIEVIAAAAQPLSLVPALGSVSSTTTGDSVGKSLA